MRNADACDHRNNYSREIESLFTPRFTDEGSPFSKAAHAYWYKGSPLLVGRLERHSPNISFPDLIF
jgi:hypothetical protein